MIDALITIEGGGGEGGGSGGVCPPGAEARRGGTPVQCELEASALPSHWEGDTSASSGRVALCEWAASFPTGPDPTIPSAAAAVPNTMRANATLAKETMVGTK